MADTKTISYSQIPLFEGIRTENLNELLHCLHNYVREYEKGEVVIIEEENIQHIGIVLRGTVHMLKYDYWGKQTMLAYMGQGEMFGEVFAVQKKNNSQVSPKPDPTNAQGINTGPGAGSRILTESRL